MKLIVLPGWLKAPLANASVGYEVLTRLDELENILSKEDVAFYFHAQRFLGAVLPEEVVQTFDMGFSSRRLLDEARIDMDEYDTIVASAGFNGDNPKDLVRLFGEGDLVSDANIANVSQFLPKVLTQLDQDIVIELQQNLKSVQDHRKDLYQFTSDALGVLDTRNGIAEAAKTPLMDLHTRLAKHK